MANTNVNYDDPRIGKLPIWAQELIADGRKARTNADQWRSDYMAKCEEIDKVRADHARANGAATFDTWVVTGDDGDTEIRHGLGVGTDVEFGDSADLCPEYTVTYVDGGLNIKVDTVGAYDLKIGGMGDSFNLRVS